MVPSAPYDRWLIALVGVLVGLGLLMVASASIGTSDHDLHQPFYYFYRQLVFLLFGIAVGSVVIQFEITYLEKVGQALLLGVMVLLALVLIPGIGRSVNGSMRWIGYGSASIQVSEVAKFIVVIYLAGYIVRHKAEMKTNWGGFFKPMILLGVIAVLLLREPDFGATAVIFMTALGMLFLGGMPLKRFMLLLLLVCAALAILAIGEPYRLKRLTSFLDPWSNAFTHGYQLTQSLIAFGRGGWFGEGLGNGIQKLFYLPEAHTDFVFSIWAEEAGLVGCIVIISLFVLMVWRMFAIGRAAADRGEHFGALVASGMALIIAYQAFINMGVASGLLPTKGLTLPFISYGGSSLMMSAVMSAMVLRLSFENRQATKPHVVMP